MSSGAYLLWFYGIILQRIFIEHFVAAYSILSAYVPALPSRAGPLPGRMPISRFYRPKKQVQGLSGHEGGFDRDAVPLFTTEIFCSYLYKCRRICIITRCLYNRYFIYLKKDKFLSPGLEKTARCFDKEMRKRRFLKHGNLLIAGIRLERGIVTAFCPLMRGAAFGVNTYSI